MPRKNNCKEKQKKKFPVQSTSESYINFNLACRFWGKIEDLWWISGVIIVKLWENCWSGSKSHYQQFKNRVSATKKWKIPSTLPSNFTIRRYISGAINSYISDVNPFSCRWFLTNFSSALSTKRVIAFKSLINIPPQKAIDGRGLKGNVKQHQASSFITLYARLMTKHGENEMCVNVKSGSASYSFCCYRQREQTSTMIASKKWKMRRSRKSKKKIQAARKKSAEKISENLFLLLLWNIWKI